MMKLTPIRRPSAGLLAVALALVLSSTALAQDRSIPEEFAPGMAGDAAALERAMKRCEAVLANDPGNAEALVWHGAGTLVMAGRSFQSGNFQEGGKLWADALREMDAAVALAPADPGILMVRGSTLLEASRHLPAPDQARALLETGVADYEKALAAHAPNVERVPAALHCQLLFGLGDGWERLGDREKARGFYRRVADECKGSGREADAAKRLGNASH
jgi:hypothetical protein